MKGASFFGRRYCTYPGCNFQTVSIIQAGEHSALKGPITGEGSTSPAASTATGFELSRKPDYQNSPTESVDLPSFKTCPDCAEEVRGAARKCRFCGYMFLDVNSGASHG